MKLGRTGLGVLVLSGALAQGCSSVRVATDWDRQFDFSALHTYSWAPSKDSGEAQGLPFLDRRIRQAVDAELAERGFQPHESGGDFLVVYTVKIRNRVDVYAYGPAWNRWGGIDRYREGTLVLGIVD